MYSKNERANRAMEDAVAAGVTCFAPGRAGAAKIVANPEGALSLMMTVYGVAQAAVLNEVAAWTGTGAGDNETAIRIRRWLNENY